MCVWHSGSSYLDPLEEITILAVVMVTLRVLLVVLVTSYFVNIWSCDMTVF